MLLIWPGQPEGLAWGFTHERWAGSVLVREEHRVVCWNLHARQEGRGFFRDLKQAIERDGLHVAVPCPMPNMVSILLHYGFVRHDEPLGDGVVDVWEIL